MEVLLDLNSQSRINELNLLEKELQQHIIKNWSICFPNYIFIKQEFILSGDVRQVNKKGRIDILAFNNETSKFVIIELKKEFDVNIRSQAFDYVDYFIEHKHEMYLKSIEFANLPSIKQIDFSDIEIVLIAKKFKSSDINIAKSGFSISITLISYSVFSKDYIYFSIVSKEQELKRTQKKVDTNNLLDDFWVIFKQLIDEKIIERDIHYKIIHFFEEATLYINIPTIYDKYVLTCKQKNTIYLDINNLRLNLKNAEYCKGVIKSTIIGKRNSSAFMFDLKFLDNPIEL